MKTKIMKLIATAVILIVPTLSHASSSTVVAWGDSLTAGAGGTPWTQQFTSLTGIETINKGIGGQSSTQVAARFLAEPALFNDFAVIWVGQNNPVSATIQTDISSMVSHLASSNYLILGVLTGDYPIPGTNTGYESIGSPGYSTLTGINSDLATIYGGHFLDIDQVLVNSYDPTLPQDVNSFNQGVVPASLRADGIHLNTKGYGIVANSIYSSYISLTSVPLPSAVWLFASSLGVLVFKNRRTQKQLVC